MGLRTTVLIIVLAVLAGLYLGGYFSTAPPSPPELGDGWWGKGERKNMKEDTSIHKFQITFGNDTINDLKSRLKGTRYFEGLEGTKFHYGVRPEYMKTFVDYWKEKYDFKKQEKYFNKFEHFRTNIEGIDIHFMHVKPKLKPGQKAKPLLISHGWPGSFYEFYKIVPMLTDPLNHGGTEEDLFEVVCPSIPGFGYSEAAHKPGMNILPTARIFGKLMSRLGHDKYYVQGGDWGSAVVTYMGLLLPEHVLGVHVNMLHADPPMYLLRVMIGSIFPSLILPKEDHHKVWPATDKFYDTLQETGYFHLQATKPDTIGHALTDSPVGLAAYILEKFSTATNKAYRGHALTDSPVGLAAYILEKFSTATNLAWRGLDDGGLTDGFDIDDLINDVMVYWLNGNMASSMRYYKENIPVFSNQFPITVPSAGADFANEGLNRPESWVRYKYVNMLQYNRYPKGGHFAAMEVPDLLAKDIREFVRKVEMLE